MGVPPHVVEAVVNYVTRQAKAGVAGIYNKAQYLEERKAALDNWAAVLDGIVHPSDESKIMSIRRRKK